MNRRLKGLRAARVAAAAIRPVQRPQTLRRRALLQEQLPVVVENQKRERPVQHAAAPVAVGLAHMADFAVGGVHQDEQFGVCCDFVRAAATVPNFIRHKDNSKLAPLAGLPLSVPSQRCARNMRTHIIAARLRFATAICDGPSPSKWGRGARSRGYFRSEWGSRNGQAHCAGHAAPEIPRCSNPRPADRRRAARIRRSPCPRRKYAR